MWLSQRYGWRNTLARSVKHVRQASDDDTHLQKPAEELTSMALSTRGHSPDSRDPSHSNGEVDVARKVVSNGMCTEVMGNQAGFPMQPYADLACWAAGVHVENDR